jgi:hypothetical protein
MIIYTIQRVSFPFHHDSLRYWELGSSFYANGQFSFVNFSDGLRGYFFPFLLSLIQRQEVLTGVDPRVLFAILSALLFTAFSMYLVPWFFSEVFRWRISIPGKAAFAALLFFFWRGHFLYPLADFPALAALLLGITILISVLRSGSWPGWFVVSGFFTAAAMNFRPVYQLSFLVVFLLLVIAYYRKNTGKLLLSIVLFISGCAVVLAPQWSINRTYFGVNSPLVIANYTGERSLYQAQLFWGLKAQKYETNIGENYPATTVVYDDPVAERWPAGEMKEKTIQNYLRIVKKYPLDMAVSYFRHAFNGLDIFFPTPYVRNIYAGHTLFSLLNYLIWFVFFIHVLRLDFSRVELTSLVAVSAILAPAILAIPAVVEIRFFLPLYILAYGVVSFRFRISELVSAISNDKLLLLRLLILAVLWIMISFTISAATVEQLVEW